MSKVLGIGLMSGTSLDGIDAVLVEIINSDENVTAKIIASHTRSYNDKERSALFNLCDPATANIKQISSMNMYLGKLFGDVVNQLLANSGYSNEDICFVSSHGQTIFHQPLNGKGELDAANTLQIGDISVLSETTGIAVAGDFRTADMAANGQGAPLVSYVDYLLFSNKNNSRAIQNIGGIGNVTYVPKNASREEVQSFDTGPGNMIIDEVVYRTSNYKQTYDKNGEIAKNGAINEELLHKMMDHEYLSMEPPKTTGRELFGKQFVDSIFNSHGHLLAEDIVATVTEFTALSIAHSYNNFFEAKGFQVDEVIIGGGGSYNSYLLERLQYHVPHINVLTHEQFNLSSDLKEAMAFALLGYNCILGKYNTIPSATGADRPVIMGKVACNQSKAFERVEALRRVSR